MDLLIRPEARMVRPQVQPEQNRIIVLAVLHCGRDPSLWRLRSQP